MRAACPCSVLLVPRIEVKSWPLPRSSCVLSGPFPAGPVQGRIRTTASAALSASKHRTPSQKGAAALPAWGPRFPETAPGVTNGGPGFARTFRARIVGIPFVSSANSNAVGPSSSPVFGHESAPIFSTDAEVLGLRFRPADSGKPPAPGLEVVVAHITPAGTLPAEGKARRAPTTVPAGTVPRRSVRVMSGLRPAGLGPGVSV